jgi:hypothetical protein
VQLIVGPGVRVLHGDLRAELGVRPQRRTKRRVAGQPGSISGGQVQLHESLPLCLRNLQTAMNVDQVGEAKLVGEVIGAAERFSLERGQMINVLRPPGAEERLERGFCKHAGAEDIDEAPQCLAAARVIIERFHNYILTEREGPHQGGGRVVAS